MTTNSRAIAKLKKRYSKWPPEAGLSGFKARFLQKLPAFFILFLLRNVLVKSDYKLKRESKTFFHYSIYAYAANKGRSCDRLLVVAFGLIDRHFDSGFVALIRNAVRLTLIDSSNRSELSENILKITKQLEISTMDATGWYQLSRGLFCLGYFRAAWVTRENSLDLSISEAQLPGASSTTLQRGIEAQLERRHLDLVRETLSESNVLSTKKLVSFRESLGWFEGIVAANKIHGTSEYGDSEKLFYELVKGKRVALVGPGSAHSEHGVEIDSAEIVARIKYPGADFLLEEKLFGIRCDISQYPGLEPLRELAAISSYEYFDDLRLIVAGGSASLPVRNTPVFCEDQELPMYRTTVTSGLRLLISLIRRSPSSLRIYGFDFYSNREFYNSVMKSFYKHDGWKVGDGALFGTRNEYPKCEVACSFGAHDPVSNFCFAQNLYKAGLFDIEPYGKSILELTPYQYVERLEEMLGDW